MCQVNNLNIKMQYLCPIFFVLIATQINSGLTALCRTTNDHKNYTCTGFPFKQMTVPRTTRQQLLRVRVFDCQETQIIEDALKFPSVENLTVSCDIQSIHPNAFRNNNHLQELDLGNNTISTISDHTFDALGELKTLNLSKNDFKGLTRNMFEGLNNLKQLIISHNRISQLDLKVLDNVRELEEIYLNDNEIRFLPARLFNKVRKLRFIDLSYNNIENLGDAFVPTYNLLHLNLSHNAIQNLPSRAFQTNRLEVLDVSYNELTVVYEDSLKLDLLKELHLRNNKISLLDINGSSSSKIALEFLDIQNNRLVFLEDDFIKASATLETLKVDRNPWDCKCFEKMEMLRYNLSFTTNFKQPADDVPLCVIGTSNTCNVDKSNLEFYFNIFKQQLDL